MLIDGSRCYGILTEFWDILVRKTGIAGSYVEVEEEYCEGCWQWSLRDDFSVSSCFLVLSGVEFSSAPSFPVPEGFFCNDLVRSRNIVKDKHRLRPSSQ